MITMRMKILEWHDCITLWQMYFNARCMSVPNSREILKRKLVKRGTRRGALPSKLTSAVLGSTFNWLGLGSIYLLHPINAIETFLSCIPIFTAVFQPILYFITVAIDKSTNNIIVSRPGIRRSRKIATGDYRNHCVWVHLLKLEDYMSYR